MKYNHNRLSFGGGGYKLVLFILVLLFTLASCRNTTLPPWALLPPQEQTKTYTVTFVMSNQDPYPEDVTMPSAEKVKEGGTVTQPDNPDAGTDWIFTGWSSSADENIPFDFTKPITGNTTVYAFFASENDPVVDDPALPSGTQAVYDSETGGYILDASKGEKPSGDLDIPAYINGVPVTGVEDSAFWNNTTITSVTFPETIKEIGSMAFCGCTGLTEITVPGNVEIIGASAFDGCGLKTVTLQEGIKEIRASAFKNNTAIETILLPSSLTTIGSGAFQGCSALTELTIPDNVTGKIMQYTLCGCSALDTLVIGKGITGIDVESMDGVNLDELILPENCTDLSTNKSYNSKPFFGTEIGKLTINSPNITAGDYFLENGDHLSGIGEVVFAGYDAPDFGTAPEGWGEDWNIVNSSSNIDRRPYPGTITWKDSKWNYEDVNLTKTEGNIDLISKESTMGAKVITLKKDSGSDHSLSASYTSSMETTGDWMLWTAIQDENATTRNLTFSMDYIVELSDGNEVALGLEWKNKQLVFRYRYGETSETWTETNISWKDTSDIEGIEILSNDGIITFRFNDQTIDTVTTGKDPVSVESVRIELESSSWFTVNCAAPILIYSTPLQ